MDAIWIILIVAIILLGGIAVYRISRGKRAVPRKVDQAVDDLRDRVTRPIDRR